MKRWVRLSIGGGYALAAHEVNARWCPRLKGTLAKTTRQDQAEYLSNGRKLSTRGKLGNGGKMGEKSLKVDRAKFEGIVKSLLKNPHIKREDVQVKNPKNRKKLIPPPPDKP